jgi:uncharacterized protein (TIGR02145 family)
VETTEGSGYNTSNYTTAGLTAPATYQVVVRNNGLCPVTSNETVVKLTDCCDAPGAPLVSFSEFNPCPSAPDASTWTLIDVRDNKTYKVKKLADGRYWMMQNLAFGNCSETSFKTDNSADATRVTPTVATDYVGHCRTALGANGGYLYNWPAAMNNVNAHYSGTQNFQCTGTSSAVNACRGICPEGWHVPTKDEFSNSHVAFTSNYSCVKDNCWNASSQWEGVLGGYCNAAGNIQANIYGTYWTSTSVSVYNANFLRFYTNNVSEGTASDNRNIGHAVRCVRNY